MDAENHGGFLPVSTGQLQHIHNKIPLRLHLPNASFKVPNRNHRAVDGHERPSATNSAPRTWMGIQ